jgi:hypothetical protein
MAGELFLTLLFYGLSGLYRHVEGGFYQDLARYCIAIFDFFIPFGDMGLKIFLLIPYSFAAAFLLISAHKYVEKKENDGQLVRRESFRFVSGKNRRILGYHM